jgi:endonuclease-3 related protein
MPRRPRTSTLLSYYRSLLRAYGPQGWWPARTPFEVIVGAILTQNVAWANVEKAIAALRRAGLLEPRRMHSTPVGRIARLIRPTGFYRQKARKLRTFLDHLRERHRGDLERFLGQRPEALRLELLSISGIGPETADSIVLYAARRPVFVVDAYTRRILARHGVIGGGESYEEIRGLLEVRLPRRTRLYNEAHALLVRVAKEHCRKALPLCGGCPLEPHLPAGGPRMPADLRRPAHRTGDIRRAGRRVGVPD